MSVIPGRQQLSDKFAKIAQQRQFGLYTRCNGGKRQDLDNQYFRSAWEANIARYLNFLKQNNEILDWKYEPDTFWFEAIKRGTRSYTPDFKIWEINKEPYYIEVKGWMDKRSNTKLQRMKKYYPAIRIDLIDDKTYRALKKQLCKLVVGWE